MFTFSATSPSLSLSLPAPPPPAPPAATAALAAGSRTLFGGAARSSSCCGNCRVEVDELRERAEAGRAIFELVDPEGGGGGSIRPFPPETDEEDAVRDEDGLMGPPGRREDRDMAKKEGG